MWNTLNIPCDTSHAKEKSAQSQVGDPDLGEATNLNVEPWTGSQH